MTRKKKRTITLSILVVLVAAMGAFYFLYEREEYEPEPFVSTFSTLVQRPETDVASVNFLHKDGDSYQMRPTHNQQGQVAWYWQPEPDYMLMATRARQKVQMAWQLTAADTVHEYTAGLNLADFGLAPPQLTMQVEYTDGTAKNIYIGYNTADMRHAFLMVTGSDAMYITNSVWADRATAGIESLIDMELPLFTLHVEHMRIIQRGVPEIELSVMYGEGVLDESMAVSMLALPELKRLRMVQPLLGRGIDEARLEIFLLDVFQEFRLQEVVSLAPASLAPYGLDNPSLEFVFYDPWEETHLIFGNRFFVDDVEYIYVKFADRPHVFKALFETADILFDFNIFMFIERFLALVDIQDVERLTMESDDQYRNFEAVLNHYGEFDIAPTVNGINVTESDFRVAYRLLIALSADSDVPPFTPTAAPCVTITFHRIQHPDTIVHLFDLDGNFYGVSVNGSDVWFVTNARDVGVMFDYWNGMLELEMPGHLDGLLR